MRAYTDPETRSTGSLNEMKRLAQGAPRPQVNSFGPAPNYGSLPNYGLREGGFIARVKGKLAAVKDASPQERAGTVASNFGGLAGDAARSLRARPRQIEDELKKQGLRRGTSYVKDQKGKGSPVRDTVSAKLAEGEAVLNAGAAEILGRDEIAALNAEGAERLGLRKGGGPKMKDGVLHAYAGEEYVKRAKAWMGEAWNNRGIPKQPSVAGYTVDDGRPDGSGSGRGARAAAPTATNRVDPKDFMTRGQAFQSNVRGGVVDAYNAIKQTPVKQAGKILIPGAGAAIATAEGVDSGMRNSDFYSDPNVPRLEKFKQGLRDYGQPAVVAATTAAGAGLGTLGLGVGAVPLGIAGGLTGAAINSSIDDEGRALQEYRRSNQPQPGLINMRAPTQADPRETQRALKENAPVPDLKKLKNKTWISDADVTASPKTGIKYLGGIGYKDGRPVEALGNLGVVAPLEGGASPNRIWKSTGKDGRVTYSNTPTEGATELTQANMRGTVNTMSREAFMAPPPGTPGLAARAAIMERNIAEAEAAGDPRAANAMRAELNRLSERPESEKTLRQSIADIAKMPERTFDEKFAKRNAMGLLDRRLKMEEMDQQQQRQPDRKFVGNFRDVRAALSVPVADANGVEKLQPDPERERQFFAWMAKSGLTDMNEALAAYMAMPDQDTTRKGEGLRAQTSMHNAGVKGGGAGGLTLTDQFKYAEGALGEDDKMSMLRGLDERKRGAATALLAEFNNPETTPERKLELEQKWAQIERDSHTQGNLAKTDLLLAAKQAGAGNTAMDMAQRYGLGGGLVSGLGALYALRKGNLAPAKAALAGLGGGGLSAAGGYKYGGGSEGVDKDSDLYDIESMYMTSDGKAITNGAQTIPFDLLPPQAQRLFLQKYLTQQRQ